MSTENIVNSLSTDLEKLPKRMRKFSRCLRSLYAENKVDSSANKATGINKLRDQTKQDAIVYVKAVMPLSTKVVRFIKEFFEYYEELGLEEWSQYLPQILEDVTGYQQCCIEIVRMHEEMMTRLKQREDEAKKLLSELKVLNKGMKKKKSELEEMAANIEEWASTLARNPTVHPAVALILNLRAGSFEALAGAGGHQVTINEAAIVVVSKALVPALSNFVAGLNVLAGFFNIMKEELTSFHSQGVGGKRLHYTMMKKKAVEVKRSCTDFYAMIPGVRSDLACIPENPRDQNRVDKWLTKQQRQIREKYPGKPKDQLQRMLKECESTEGLQQLAIK